MSAFIMHLVLLVFHFHSVLLEEVTSEVIVFCFYILKDKLVVFEMN